METPVHINKTNYMTECNYCTNERLRIEALKLNKITTVMEGALGRGMNVYIHPNNVDVYKMPEESRKLYFRAWFMKLTKKCCCIKKK